MGFLLTLTLLIMSWSLWIRRVTWRCRWEVAATLNIALQCGAVVLMSPAASGTIGVWLHGVTGLWNLEDYIGHDCYVVAASSIVYNTIGRLGTDAIMQRRFTLYVEKPATLCIPALLAAFSMGNGAKIYRADFFDTPCDGPLTMYWTILCFTLIWLLVYGSRSLIVLTQDPRNRFMACIHLGACVSGIMACIARLTTAYIPHHFSTLLVWIPACLCGGIFALASAHSWMEKTRWFTRSRLVTTL